MLSAFPRYHNFRILQSGFMPEKLIKKGVLIRYMDKKGKSRLSLAFDISGIALLVVAIAIVKLANQPLVEILAGVLATLGFGLIAGAKYV